jgi:hypothetical protein
VFSGNLCGVLWYTAVLTKGSVVSPSQPPPETVASDVSSNKEDLCLVDVSSSPYPG